MGFIIRFALKNIWRYKKRTIITFVAISIGIAAFIFLNSILRGVHYESVRNFIDYESGHLKIYNKEFYREMSDEGFLVLNKGIDDYEKLEKLINSDNISTAARITFEARLINENTDGERAFNLVGIDPEKDKDVYKLPDALISGKFLGRDDASILIGRKGAEKMEAKLGDTLTILTRTRNDTYQTISVDIAGILDPPNPNINSSFGYIPLNLADADLDMEGSVTEIGVLIKNGSLEEQINRINDILEKNNLRQLETVSWKELGKDWLTLSRSKMSASYMMILMVFIIAAVGIINTMLMSVFERVKEIGMMRALGMRDSEVICSFMLEGGFIGFLGAVLGIFFGLIIDLYLVYHGWDLSFARDMDIGYRIMKVMRGAWDFKAYIFAFLFSIIVPAIISIYPSRKAIKMEITQALRSA